eukprot:TRINITY_DN5884_c0_g1_i1.p2 TRINITY_DN5884_c0_g1~~TRINITY_DN5884_c0_g1_i1.p2  ORF type:complete len:235 (+),score=112.73 TRINITY_DN5884_c0_g1_i1:98-802(+)
MADNTLIRYDNPVLQSDTAKKGKGVGGYTSDGKKRQGVPTSDIIRSVIPAREWEAGGKHWVQQPSAAPASRLDVINLQEQLDQQLRDRRARDSGVCAVRQDLYTQTFDELIRQVTIDSPERGVLMLRVRDDLRQTVDAYRVMYESSIAFGTRKAAQADRGKDELSSKITELEATVEALELEHSELLLKCDEIAKSEKERGREDKAKFDDEMRYLKNTNNQLATLLNTMLHEKAK